MFSNVLALRNVWEYVGELRAWLLIHTGVIMQDQHVVPLLWLLRINLEMIRNNGSSYPVFVMGRRLYRNLYWSLIPCVEGSMSRYFRIFLKLKGVFALIGFQKIRTSKNRQNWSKTDKHHSINTNDLKMRKLPRKRDDSDFKKCKKIIISKNMPVKIPWKRQIDRTNKCQGNVGKCGGICFNKKEKQFWTFKVSAGTFCSSPLPSPLPLPPPPFPEGRIGQEQWAPGIGLMQLSAWPQPSMCVSSHSNQAEIYQTCELKKNFLHYPTQLRLKIAI